jgi:protein involved in polysaccharide export with SLBB domain
MAFRFFLLILLACLTACATGQKNSGDYERMIESMLKKPQGAGGKNLLQVDDIPQFEATADLVAPGFLFGLSHPSDEKLTGRFRIGVDGLLLLPYNVRIQTEGLTFPELKDKVLKAYGAFFQKGVQSIVFRLIEKKYFVEVRGFVKKSGHYLVSRKESIDKLIDRAGGVNGDLKRDLFTVSIKQMDESYSISLNQYFDNNMSAGSFTWTGRDSLFVNPLTDDAAGDAVPTVTILGGVVNPGKTLYQPDANFFYYLHKSGGVIANLSYEEIYIFRNHKSGIQKIKFDVTDIENIPTIKPNDIILMNADKRTKMDKVFERLTQIGAILSTVALLIIAL